MHSDRSSISSMPVLESPHDFEISLADGRYSLIRDSSRCQFSRPLRLRRVAKLYAISSDGSLVYVGIIKQPISARLGYGFRANGKRGYHGYKWKFLEGSLRLSVWTARSNAVYASLDQMEIVEAEVAYLCRHRSGQWPTHQNEIHFFPSESWHRDAATQVYEHAISDLR